MERIKVLVCGLLVPRVLSVCAGGGRRVGEAAVVAVNVSGRGIVVKAVHFLAVGRQRVLR